MMIIKIWASAHTPLPEQGEGFILLSQMGEEGKKLQEELNNTPSEVASLRGLAERLCKFATENGGELYQPGGSPAFQAILGVVAEEMGVVLNYAHSVRESKEEKLPDGTIKKVAVFRHQGWIRIQPAPVLKLELKKIRDGVYETPAGLDLHMGTNPFLYNPLLTYEFYNYLEGRASSILQIAQKNWARRENGN